MKILLIVFLVGILVYFLSRRFFMSGNSTAVVRATHRNSFLLVDTSPQVLSSVSKRTLWTVGIGFILFLIILVLGIKIKIIWIALPLSLYLIAQLLVYTNHVKAVRDQRVYFDPTSNEVWIERIGGSPIYFNLLQDVKKVTEVKSVQQNRGVLFGYYELKLHHGHVFIPYLVEQHQHTNNKLFFDRLNQHFSIVLETKLFPVI